ncbi:hypothetical protein CGCF245_v008832 [Colletotrichum fructicola]|nr:hypothetical protein CGCF245_v008832 [Colletotrichum fructicola]
MADTEAKGPKKVRIEEPFAKQTEPDVTDNTHNNVHWVTDDTGDADADSQSYTYATTNSSDASNLFDEVEERGLSVTLPLEPRDVQATIQLPPRSVFDAWKGPKTTIAEMSAEVQMFTIHSVEFSVGHSQREKVSITWCLITYSPKAASELQEGLIHQVSSKPPQQGFLKMIFIHDNNERVSTEVGQDWTYVDLMQHAVSLIKQTRWAAGDFHLEDAQGERLYAKSWLELATSGSTDLGIIYIRKSKPGDPVTPVSCRTTPRRVSVTKMITYKPLDESQPSEANFLPDGSRTFGRLEDPANQSEDEKPTRRGTTGVGPETESNSIDFGENDDSRENESPPGNIPIEEDTQYVAEPVEEKALSLNDENINMESVETNGSIHHEPRNLQPKINPASSVKENDPDSGSTFSVENAYTDEFQDDPSNLYIRNIDSSTTSEKYLVPITRPFLEWRTQGVKINRSSEEIIKNTGSILDKLHADMIEGLNKDIYSVAFRCTPEDLWARSSINLPYKQSGFEQVSNIAGDVPKTLGSNAESEDQAENPTTTADNTFVADLLDLNRRVKELHALVARPGKLADADKIIPPQLPTNLMLALDGIVTVHIMHSNQLSLMNQLEYINADPTREIPRDVKSKVEKSIKTMEARRIAAWTLTRNLFESSQRDIMRLKHTTREDDNAAVETVGVEFLALALMSNAQKRPILSEPIINIEDIYRIQMSRMRSEAVRRPKRRLFLELSALQEELDAVDGIVEAQQKLLANYLDLLSPDSFRKENETRARLHTAETRVAKRHKRMLDERHETLHSLQERATAFREQVKQTIEVLEEDHGKAIRVFTIVTLFFLPMSFISSFLGMNTTDIRDTEFDQRFFWIVSIPVTAVVVVLAMTYGYKSDDINDWLYQKMHQPRQKLSRVVHIHHTDRSQTQSAPSSGAK